MSCGGGGLVVVFVVKFVVVVKCVVKLKFCLIVTNIGVVVDIDSHITVVVSGSSLW